MRRVLSVLRSFNIDDFILRDLSIKSYSKHILISIFLFVVICIIIPFYYETGSESHFKIIYSGVFSGNPQGIFKSFGAHIFIGDIISFLYNQFPVVKWYDIFISVVYGILIGQVSLLFNSFFTKSNLAFKVITVSILIFLFQNVINLDPLRISLFLSVSSLLILLNYKLSYFLKVWLFLMFVLGLLVRIESGVLALVFVTLAELFYKGFNRFQYKKFSLYYIVLFLLLCLINLPNSEEDEEYLRIRPYQFALWDYYNKYPEVKFESKSDSVIFYSTTYAFMADREKINVDFFKRIGLKTTDKKPSDIVNYLIMIPNQLDRLDDYFYQYIICQSLLWLYLVLIIFLAHFIYRRHIPNLLMTMTILSVLLIIAVIMKMEMRLFFALLSLIVLLIYFYGSITKTSKTSHIPMWLSIIVGVIVVVFSLKTTSQYIRYNTEYYQSMHQAKLEIAKLPASSLVFLDLATTIHWYSFLFEDDVPLSCQVIPLDNGLIYLTKGHQQKLKTIFDCLEFECYMDRIMNMNETYFLAVPERKNIIENYMLTVYDKSIELNPIYTTVKSSNLEIPSISIYSVSRK